MKNWEKIAFLLKNAWKTAKRYVVISVAVNIFEAALSFGDIVGIGLIVDALLTKRDSKEVLILVFVFCGVNFTVTTMKELFSLAEQCIGRKTSNTAQFRYAEDSVNIDYHYAQDGTVLDLKKKSQLAFPAFYVDKMGNIIKYIVQFFAVVAVITYFSPHFLLVIGATTAISVLLIFKTKSYENAFEDEKIKEDRKLDYLYKIMTQYRFAKEVRVNRAEGFTSKKYDTILLVQVAKLKNLFQKRLLINSCSTLIAVLQTAAMYLYFTFLVCSEKISISEYTVALGSTILLTTLILGFFERVAWLGRVCRVLDYYFEYSRAIEAYSTVIDSNTLPEVELDFSTAVIRFENVSFKYPNSDSYVLTNINLEIQPGERLALVGLNGSGKTTIVKLLTRLYDPSEGRITVNGIDIRTVPYKQYSKQISIVLQDCYIFAFSIKENVILDNVFDRKLLYYSLDKSGLTEKIKKLKSEADTFVSKTLDKDGIEFSGGEGQKLALARAIYKNASVFVLDEPTSALDPLAEFELFSRLNEISQNRATLFISHRLSSTKTCDRIAVLSAGEIVEIGRHDELMVQGGEYQKLFSMQAKYYR